MKIAIAVENGQVCGHFGHSPSFSFYEVEEGNIVSSENIQSPGEGHGIPPAITTFAPFDAIKSGRIP